MPDMEENVRPDKPFEMPFRAGSDLTGLSRMLDEAEIIDEDIIGVESGDIVNRIELAEKHNKIKNLYNESFYSDLIFILTNVRLDEKTAREDWRSILRHKKHVSEKLGRNVGIRVATLDFYTNINKQIVSPKIIDMKEYTKTVKESITDSLTFCYNRRYFDYIIKHYCLVARESDKALSLCMADIDFFKQYNDHNGHIAGDLALIEISRILNAVTAKTDLVARYGGEEFCIIMPSTGLDQAWEKAEQARIAVQDYRFTREQDLPGKRLTLSLGVAALANGGGHLALIQRADEAMYAAKRAGRNAVFRAKEAP